MSLSSQLFKAAFIALVEENENAIEPDEDDPLVEALTTYTIMSNYEKYKHILLMPKTDIMPQTIYGIVDIIATSKNEDLNSKTLVAAAVQISPKLDRFSPVKRTVALKITLVPGQSKISGTFLDGIKDVAGEFKNAAKITKKHGVSNMFVNAHHGAFPCLFYYNGVPQVAFAWSMEFCKGGTLNDFNDWLCEQKWLSEEQRIACLLPIIYGLLTALKQLHSLHLGHRDLHEGNVLFDEDGVLNIGDFGRAKKKVMNPKVDLDQTVYGDANNPPPDSTHPHPATLSTFTDEAYYDPLGVDLWSVGTLISDMLCPPDKQLKWPTDEQIKNTKRPKLIQLCVDHRKSQVKKFWTPIMKKILDGRLFTWTLDAFRVNTKGVTITDKDIKFLFRNQKVDDSIFKAVWKYYYNVKRRELDPFLTPEEKEEAKLLREETEPNLPIFSGSSKAKSREKAIAAKPIAPPPKMGRLPPKKRYLDDTTTTASTLPPSKRQRTNPH